ncbi:UDP-N-acetylmuramoyl-L-alanyl-D-glutamate--2,6-diaminopimelate ligase [Carnobacteriaceae bacterium zg-ZUI252]|nr:UDP-N-acetylmuramoyl-L-alanyl-D-glutamate--2,6-diaminopimelate ligase [Carnobacteriaceae bacterium zg-ZUI252]MBS4769579.1 UDP-N-acetylmuramoyl-L-alanyl-D-glutamate--2,6-diaminopimelate ligase [Carnobacteriaceae bacterium zg-ZUI240]QTU83044.1 UDP-N-acetylmuramoyl-L-alanyl-D-glutamate--2,6-diaminopimelate ligase [Carnobacteriaceae bacterium zg-C25]
MNIQNLLKECGIQSSIGNSDLLTVTVNDLCYDARLAKSGSVFFAMPGRSVDGVTYIPQAYENGARIFVSQKAVDIPADALLVVVEDARKALSSASHHFFGQPSHKLKVVGITGTKGKTTTTTLLYKILSRSGIKAGVIGTNGAYFADRFIPTSNTTPESYDIHKIFKAMIDEGIEVCFIEVSSQGLMMHRVDDVRFEIGVFTNMAHDHISPLEHATFEEYLHWKTHLFTLAKTALVNVDDAYVDAFITQPNLTVYTYGIDNAAQFRASDVQHAFDGNRVGMSFVVNGETVHMNVPGKFNVYNALVVLGVGALLGGDVEKCRKLLNETSVPGRMEVIENDKGVLAILDYAHNGFALENVLTTLQQYEYNRLIVLFGSVGDRSQNRRLELGQVVAKYADVAMVTSDNPGCEDPQQIIDDIVQAFEGYEGKLLTQVDRKLAIEQVVSMAQEKDIVLFAGKGHETYQLIGKEKLPFNEKQIIMNAFEISGKNA